MWDGRTTEGKLVRNGRYTELEVSDSENKKKISEESGGIEMRKSMKLLTTLTVLILGIPFLLNL